MDMFKGIFASKGSVNINGNSYSGRSITISGNRVIVDGVVQDEELTSRVINVSMIGDATEVRTVSGNIEVSGKVGTVTTTSGDVRCGHVDGDIKTVSGDVDCAAAYGKITTISGDIIHR